MDLQDGCDLTDLISDKFTINSAGKTPQSRKEESLALKFSSRMLPQSLSFDEVDCYYGSAWNNASELNDKNKSQFKMEEESNFDIDSIGRSMMLNRVDGTAFCENKLEDSFDLNAISFTSKKTPIKNSVFSMRSNSSPLKSIGNTLCNSPLLEKNAFTWRSNSDLTGLCTSSSNFNKLESPKSRIEKENVNPVCKGSVTYFRQLEMTESEKFCAFNLDSGKTPSKFSVVRNSLSQYLPSRSPKKLSDTLLHQDFASRDSGFENSSSFVDSHIKIGETVPDYCDDFQKLKTRFDGYEIDVSEKHFETNVDFCEPSTSTNHFLPDPFSSIDTLQDLEVEFDSAYQLHEPSCSKYEIISTDSPDICSSSGKMGTIIARNFQFGSPIGDSETSENFETIPKLPRKMPARSETTRMLNFDTETTPTSFKFIPPKMLPPKKPDLVSPCKYDKKSPYSYFTLKSKVNSCSPVGERKVGEKSPHFEKDETVISNENSQCKAKKMRVDSGIDGDTLSPFVSPLRHLDEDDNVYDDKFLKRSSSRSNKNVKPSRLFDCVSSSSLESGCVTEMEECMFDVEEHCQESEDDDISTVPSSLHALISGEIKTEIKTTPNRIEESAIENVSNERPVLRRCFSLQTEEGVERVRAALFRSPGKARKRTEMVSESVVLPKRRRSQVLRSIIEVPAIRPLLQRTISDNEATIKMALSRAYNEPDLIGDFSRPFCLPLDESQHEDLKSISGDTLAALIRGEFKDTIDSFQVIDCRYPYEFEGGHIVGAQNLYTEDLVHEKLLASFPSKSLPISRETSRNIIIFHCEFSSERGPKLCRYLRRADRALNRDSYPALLHAELYVLRDGYRVFHGRHAHHCRPVAGGYIAMLDPQHAPALRHHRAAASRRALQ